MVSRRGVIGTGVAVLAGGCIGELDVGDFSDESPSWDPDATAKVAHEAVNRARSEAGVGSLGWRSDLATVATNYAAKMAREGFFSHTAPDGSNFEDRYREAGISCRVPAGGNQYYTGGENIHQTWWMKTVETENGERMYSTPTELGEGITQAWMNSPPHRENLLASYWRDEGIGVARDEKDRVYAVQNFC